MTLVLVIHRKSFEFEDASSLQSLYPSSPTENGTESQPKFGSKSTLEENAYEDIVGKQWPGWQQNRNKRGTLQVLLRQSWAARVQLLGPLKEMVIRGSSLARAGS